MARSTPSPTTGNPKRTVILQHAIEVFAREGFRSADVQHIADRAGVGKGTVYRIFGNKEELFNAATFDVLQRLDHAMFAALENVQDPLEALHRLGVAHARFFDRNPSCLEIFVQGRAEFRGTVPEPHQLLQEEMIRRVMRIVEAGIVQGRIRPDDPRTIVVSLGTVLYGTIMFGCYVADTISLPQLSEEAVSGFLRGIRTTD